MGACMQAPIVVLTGRMTPMRNDIPEELRGHTETRRPKRRDAGRRAIAIFLIALLVLGGMGAAIASVI